MSGSGAVAAAKPAGFAFPPGVSIAGIIGPFQYGLLISWALLGLLIHQVYIYHTRFAHKDPLIFKLLVRSVCAIEIILVLLMTHLVHGMVIESWGNPTVFFKLPWSGAMLALSTGIMALIVQSFFLWRLWKLNHDSRIIRIFVALVVPVAFIPFACSIVLSNPGGYIAIIELNKEKNVSTEVSKELAFLSTFACDLFITGLMVVSLLRLRRKSKNIQSMGMKINTLLIRAVETGAVTSVVALIALILFADPKLKQTAYFIAPHLALGRLYSTMLMTNLNGRGHFSGTQEATEARTIEDDVESNKKSSTLGSTQQATFSTVITIAPAAEEAKRPGW